jgi:hypothetical protein
LQALQKGRCAIDLCTEDKPQFSTFGSQNLAATAAIGAKSPQSPSRAFVGGNAVKAAVEWRERRAIGRRRAMRHSKDAFGFRRHLNSPGAVTALILFAVAVVAYAVFGARLSSVILGPRSATAAEILASIKSGDSHQWFELTEQPELVLTTQFSMVVHFEKRIVTFHLMRAPSAPELPISTMGENPTAPFDVWTCNPAESADDYGRGVSAALKQANLPMSESFMLCEAENTRTATRLSATLLLLWCLMVAIAGAHWLTVRLLRIR